MTAINNPEPTLLIDPSSRLNGPKFSKREKTGLSSWLKKNGTNIIIPIIAICILVGGIYLYKRWPAEDKNQLADLGQLNFSVSPEQSSPELSEQSLIASTTEETAPQEIVESTSGDKKAITVQAKKGEGLTHLGRKALSQYLKDDPGVAQKLTKEHKIYIEDYLKDKKVAEREKRSLVEIDESILFEEDLIKKAVEKSLELNAEQLKKIEPYSVLVPSL